MTVIKGEATRGYVGRPPIIEAKIQPPGLREGSVHRPRLVDPLVGRSDPPVVSLIAPPGYGKTTVLAQWAAVESRPIAWLTLDQADNDLSVLMRYLVAALDRVRPFEPGVARSISGTSERIAATAVPRLASELHRWELPAVLVLDDAHLLVDRACLDAVDQLIRHLPDGFGVLIAGRSEPAMPFGELRAQRRLLEIGVRQLALDERETVALCAAAGWEITPARARELLRATEGWAAAIYLAALAAARGGPEPSREVSGTDRYIAAYLRTELEQVMEADDARFLAQTAILERVEPRIAEFVTRMSDAAGRLDRLARQNLLIQPVGPGSSYRYHHLLRDYLVASLDRGVGPDAPELHRRAAEWFAASGDPRPAIHHANAAGDPDLAARILLSNAMPAWQTGQVASVQAWMASMDLAAIQRNPALAGPCAWVYAMSGMPDMALLMAGIVERADYEGPPGDGTASLASQRAMVRALVCASGPRDMLDNAERAVALEPAGSAWRGQALMLLGAARILVGDLPGAEMAYEDALDAGRAIGAPPVAAFVLRAGIALARGDVAAGIRWGGEARRAFATAGHDGLMTSLLLHAVDARLAIAEGDLPRAREALVQAQLLRPLASHAIPWFSVYALLHLAHAYLAVADPGGAQVALREAEVIVRRRPGLGVLTDELLVLRGKVRDAASTIGGASTLTAAELRILPLLPTYLSFQDIADRLMISRNTVKTHAMSIYGKLWASSRGEAVERAVELGLLEPYPGLPAPQRSRQGASVTEP